MGSRCTYKNCLIRRDGNIHMFKYPVQYKLRCKKWILNAQKLEFINLKNSQLRSKVICQYHFKDEDFQNDRKNKLTLDAVPTVDGPYCSDVLSYRNNYNFITRNQISKCAENEIEIEEHDVLDDPTIKRIFPDLSVIKKEILQYEEVPICNSQDMKQKDIGEIPEAKPIIQQEIKPKFSPHIELNCGEAIQQTTTYPNITTNSMPQTITDEAPIDTKLETHLRFKTFLDSLVDDYYDITDENFDDESNTNAQYFNDDTPSKSSDLLSTKTTGGDYKVIGNNIFIFGSKPSTEVKVVLKDISTYLNASKQYCKKCRILFPNVQKLKCHTTKVHSTKQKVMAFNKIKKTVKAITIQCNMCNVKFANKGNMHRHMRRLHNDSKTINTRNIIAKLNRSTPDETNNHKTNLSINTNDKTNPTTGNQCFHCTQHFESSSALIEHLYAIIRPNKIVGGENGEGKRLSKKVEKSNTSSNDDHTVMSHKVTCSECSLNFTSQKDLNEHSRKRHKNKSRFYNKHNSDEKYCVQQTHPSYDEETNTTFIESTNKIVSRGGVKENTSPLNTENNGCIENVDNKYECWKRDDNQPSFIQEFDDQEIISTNSDTITQEKKIYQCFICSIYITYFKWYSIHLKGHNINITRDVEKTSFDPQCKFCKLKYRNVQNYNKHMSTSHSEKKTIKIRLDNKAFQSVLFECLKCNIFFLSANAANAHSEHKYIYAEWTCLKCQKSFKTIDKQLHLKQHLISKNITTYILSDSALSCVLYKCSKCAVHFNEEKYFLHSTACGMEPPDAAYCNICDILINRNDKDLHEHHHNKKELDFTLIESDFFANKVKKNTGIEIDSKLKIHSRSKFALTFCHTCNCFVSDLSSTRKAHIEKRCGIICPRMCKICGLIFTNRGYISHKMLHDEVKNLTLQAFYFYDINSKKQIRPPMPKYPNCNICEVHFLNKTIMKQHECHQQKFTMCDICKMKFTEAAFRLHMKFHNYKISTACNKKLVIKYKNDDPTSDITINSKGDSERDVSLNNNKALEQEDSAKQSEFLYTCVSCHVTVHNYDKVVEHCHDHYIYKEIKTSDSKNYSIEEKFDKSVMFDPFYLRFDNNVWIKHIFINFTNEQIMERVADSIYKFECRLKMEVIQSGPANLTLYKCSACRSYIDPSLVLQHTGNTCITAKKYPCSHCGIVFYSSDYRNTHEKIHRRPGIKVSSHRIVLYNKTEHQQFIKIMINSQNKFILYQCRNCEGIVDKLDRDSHQCYFETLIKCSYCELLYYNQDYNSHVVKHETISSFDSAHIIVVMFGKIGSRNDDMPKSTFSGTIYDLTFYKCESCGLCLGSKNKMSGHDCVVKLSKSICPKCHLCFLKSDLNAHLQLHEKNIELEYGDFYSNIIPFNISVKETNTVKPMKIEECSWKQNKDTEERSVLKDDSSSNTKQTIYKCECGLHFLEIDNARKHSSNCQPKAKISKQHCFKCDLLFTPGELFNHLLKHHSKKKVKYDYDIVTVGVY